MGALKSWSLAEGRAAALDSVELVTIADASR